MVDDVSDIPGFLRRAHEADEPAPGLGDYVEADADLGWGPETVEGEVIRVFKNGKLRIDISEWPNANRRRITVLPGKCTLLRRADG